MLADIFGGTVFGSILATIIGGGFLAMVPYAWRAVRDSVLERQAEQLLMEAREHLSDRFMFGVAGDDDHDPIPGFIEQWPKYQGKIDETHVLVKRELGNGGHSMADRSRVLEGKVDTLTDLVRSFLQGRNGRA